MVFSLFPHTLWFVQTCSWEIPIKQWGISSEPCLLLREQISWYQLVGDSHRIAGLIVSLIKGYTTFNNWFVVWNMNFIYPYIGKNHPKLTNSFIFQRGRSTTNQFHDINISVFCWWKIAIVDGYMCTYLFPTTIMQFSASDPISHFESKDSHVCSHSVPMFQSFSIGCPHCSRSNFIITLW